MLNKIVFHLNDLAHGGAQRFVSNLANRFAEAEYEVYIATEWYAEEEFAIDPRIKRVHVGLSEKDEAKSRISKFLIRLRNLKRFAGEVKPDVLVAIAQSANYRGLMACGNSDIPVVISIRTDPKDHYERFGDAFMIRHYFPKAAGCVYQTEDQRAFFKPYLQEGTRIILNPVNPKYFEAPRLPREKSVVQHARIVGFKNHAMLIDAFMKVHEKHPDYVLKIYGPDDGDGTWQKLEAQIKDYGAESFVFLMGDSDTLEQEIPKGSVYAFSSDWEGLPNTLLEAMAMGMPVVACDCPCGGPKTVVEPEVNGLLVPVKDADAMAEGIMRLIEDPEFAGRLGENARKIRERTDIDGIFEQWKDYLEEIVKNKKKR
ncbi:MAG: glycosyltransferase [Lachnospiraceae bacterium]|nr:glycosyltransferase [Lachnospiraceae bacterium]